MTQVLKKSGMLQDFDENKIKRAIEKSATRVVIELTEAQKDQVCKQVKNSLLHTEVVPVSTLHNLVETALDTVEPKVAKSYREYRDNKASFARMLDKVYNKKLSLSFIGDRSNANADSAIVTTQRAIVYNELNSELYKKFFLTVEEEKAMSEGYIYIHDRGSRLDSFNCFRRDTRFITDQGVKSFYDFKDGDTTMVLSHKGIWRKATVHSYGWQPIQEITFKRNGRGDYKVYATKNHRWILKDGTTTTDLKIGDKLVKTPKINDIDWDTMSRKEKQLWCIGFAYADGSVKTEYNKYNTKSSLMSGITIRLCGEKSKYAYRFIESGYSVTSPKCFNGDLSVYVHSISSKKLPYTLINYNNVKYFMSGYMAADGNKRGNLEYRGVYCHGDNNNFLYDFLNMSGYYVTKINKLDNLDTNFGKRQENSYSYNLYTSTESGKTWVVKDIIPVKLNPMASVWCLDVEEDHSFLLENGIPTGNCCLSDVKEILTGGFEMGNLHYNEPKTLDVAFDLIGDIIMNMASCQYGGYTISEIDKLLAPYAKKSYDKYYNESLNNLLDAMKDLGQFPLTDSQERYLETKSYEYAMKKVKRDFEQGWQGLEMKLNSVGSSRGDYPFTAVSFGLGKDKFETLCTSVALDVRKNGQGKDGFKHPVLFPKLSFLYDEALHGEGKELEWLFLEAIDCSSKSMYPDFISCTGDGYCGDIYRKYGKTISRMGCRATLAPWYVRGGFQPADENDYPIFEGRMNMGAISIHFPMILKKAQLKAEKENKNVDDVFFDELNYYCSLIRDIHKRTFDTFAEKKAGTNPMAFCQGGIYGGHFNPEEKIGREFLRPMTASFGITALNETQYLYNGKSLVEDQNFAIRILQWMDDLKKRATKEDGILYALYGTPAESLCGLQVEQYRKMFGEQEGITDKPYTSNSFHCAVYEDITPIQKQDIEYKMYHYCAGGAIQYCRYPIDYNKDAIITLVRRAMKMGFYEGINLQLDYCEECGHQFIDSDTCPKCGSDNITRIERMNGYLGYSKVHGRTMYADHKLQEFKDRKSM